MMILDTPAPDQKAVPAIAILEFWTDHEPEKDAKGNVVPGQFRAVDWVKWAKKGTNTLIGVDKVHRIKRSDPIVYSVVQGPYERWKKGQDEPTTGTAIEAWPGLTKGQCHHLRGLNIRSVEDLALTTDADLERIGMGARGLRDRARAYIAAKTSGEAKLAEELASRDAQLADQKREIDELKVALAHLSEGLPKRQKPPDMAGKAA